MKKQLLTVFLGMASLVMVSGAQADGLKYVSCKAEAQSAACDTPVVAASSKHEVEFEINSSVSGSYVLLDTKTGAPVATGRYSDVGAHSVISGLHGSYRLQLHNDSIASNAGTAHGYVFVYE